MRTVPGRRVVFVEAFNVMEGRKSVLDLPAVLIVERKLFKIVMASFLVGRGWAVFVACRRGMVRGDDDGRDGGGRWWDLSRLVMVEVRNWMRSETLWVSMIRGGREATWLREAVKVFSVLGMLLLFFASAIRVLVKCWNDVP